METIKANIVRLTHSVDESGVIYETETGFLIPASENIRYKDCKYFHLYFTTNEEIKKGDWYLDGMGNRRKATKEDQDVFSYTVNCGQIPSWTKIIATTDPNIWEHDDTVPYSKKRPALPKPSEDFIEKYCISNGINEVLIKLEWLGYDGEKGENIRRIKVNHHNEITIHPIKKEFTREDVIHALAYACGEAKKGLTHAEILTNYKKTFNV